MFTIRLCHLLTARLLVCLLVYLCLAPAPAAAQSAPAQTCDPVAVQPSGAEYITCVPANWNGQLIVLAGPYVAPTEPVGFPEAGRDEQLEQIEGALGLLGYAVAVTSYRETGLSIQSGVADAVELVRLFNERYEAPSRTFLVGISEGGLVAALGVEREPALFDGGLALCGPYGDFQRQTNYFGDFRVLFDYFFPSLLPASPVEIPESLINEAAWDAKFASDIRPALADPANADALDDLFAASGAPFEAGSDMGLTSQISVTERLLWYNIFGTNDASAKLGGQPFDNAARTYGGTGDGASDAALNEGVARFTAAASATQTISDGYQTSGNLSVPLVTVHTTRDPIVPSFHADLYAAKVAASGSDALYEHISVDTFGHCAFSSIELFGAFNRMIALADAQPAPPMEEPIEEPSEPALFLPLVSRS